MAVSVLVGESMEDAIAALPEGSDARPHAAELVTKLRDQRRAVRAQGLAVVAQEVAMALFEVTLR